MPLSELEVRVFGALMEKERTTPDGYPLSSQALVAACNQRTNRDPVTDYHLQEVMAAVSRLRDRALAETIQEVGDRVPKHKNRAAKALELDARQFAVVAVLLLRGDQTPGELRARTERYVEFASVAAVEETLTVLADRSAPLVKRLGRAPGQSQDRWGHTLGADEEKMVPRARPPRHESEVPRASFEAALGTEEPRAGGEVAPIASARQAQPVAEPLTAERFEALSTRIDALSGRLDYLVSSLETLERRLRLLETGS